MNLETIRARLEEELDLTGVDPEVQETVVTELGRIILERITFTLLAMDKDSVFKTMIDEGKLGEAFAYVYATFPETDEIIQGIVDSVVLEYKQTS